MTSAQGARSWLTARLRVLTVAGILAAVFSLLESWWYLADLMAHLRLHLAFGLGFCAVLFITLRSWKWMGIALVPALILATWCFYAILSPVAPEASGPDDSVLRILSHNVKASNTRQEDVLDNVRRLDPDVVILLEIRGEWESTMKELEKLYPWALIQAESDNFGLAFFSRIPVEDSQIEDFSGYEIPSSVALLDFQGQKVQIVGTHPIPGASSFNHRVRNWHLNDLAQHAEEAGMPFIAAGDFNMTPWSAIYREFVHISGLLRAAPSFRPTWHLYQIPGLGLPIDHIFVSHHWRVQDWRVGEAVGSDHRWIMTDLVLEPAPSSSP